MSTNVTGLWYTLPGTGTRVYRAHAHEGSVSLLASQVPNVRASVKAHGGTMVRELHYTIGPKTPPVSVLDAKRVARMRWGLAHEPGTHYTEKIGGPNDRTYCVAFPLFDPQWGDCSSEVIANERYAGAEDPCGYEYKSIGNSTAMTAHLKHLQLAQLQVGDIVTFGPAGSAHATQVYEIETIADALHVTLWSHGQEAGPLLVTLESEHAAHGNGDIYYLRRLGAAA